jgi:hypothetical protein
MTAKLRHTDWIEVVCRDVGFDVVWQTPASGGRRLLWVCENYATACLEAKNWAAALGVPVRDVRRLN